MDFSPLLFVDKENVLKFNNRLSIKSFIETYYNKRYSVYKDLYWDVINMQRDMFFNLKVNERIQINDGYTVEDFHTLYERFNLKVMEIIK